MTVEELEQSFADGVANRKRLWEILPHLSKTPDCALPQAIIDFMARARSIETFKDESASAIRTTTTAEILHDQEYEREE